MEKRIAPRGPASGRLQDADLTGKRGVGDERRQGMTVRAWNAVSGNEQRLRFLDKGEAEAPPSPSEHYWRVATPSIGLVSAVRINTVCAIPVVLKVPSDRYAPLLVVPIAPLKPETE
jgi:hypothetical protein